MGILSWIAMGLIVGLLAKSLMPGKDPGGLIVTVLIGAAGAFLGGCVGSFLGAPPPFQITLPTSDSHVYNKANSYTLEAGYENECGHR